MGEKAPLPALSRPAPARTALPRSAPRPGAPARPRFETPLLFLNFLSVFAIAALDAATPAGIVVGVLLVGPVLAAALSDRPVTVVATYVTAMAAYAVATVVGARASLPDEIRLANRILVVVTVASAAYLGVALQIRRRRSQSEAETLDAAQINRILMSLIVHDLRTPLITAMHTLDYLEPRLAGDDQVMVTESRARLRRNVRLVDAYLAVAQKEAETVAPEARMRVLTGDQLSQLVNDEVATFRPEAIAREKQLLVYHTMRDGAPFCADVLVMQHALAILLDNAVRYAVPGPIRVTTRVSNAELTVTVEDSGPGTAGHAGASAGTGLGLELCAALLERAGGELRRERDDVHGACFAVHLPLTAVRASVRT